MRFAVTLAVLLAVALPVAAEDVVVLKDGQKISGKIVSENDKEIRIKVGDGEFILPRSLVGSVEREGPAPAAEGQDVIKLKADGREVHGTILAEDEKTITMKVGDTTLGFDKAVIEWVRKGGEVRRFGPAPGEPAPAAPPAPPMSPAMESWAKVCLDHLASEDPAVQRSAGMALRMLGPAARPLIEAAASGSDERIAAAARRLLTAGPGEGGPRAGPGGPGGPGGQGEGGPGRGRGNFVERLAEQLQLTEDQKPKVAAVLDESMQKRREIRDAVRNGEMTAEDAQAKSQEIGDESLKKLSGILTEEQLARYKEMMDRMRGGGRGGGGGRIPR